MTDNVVAFEDLRAAAKKAMAEDELSQAAAAKRIGVSSPTFSQWLNGKYAGDVPTLEAKVRRWLAGRKRGATMVEALPAIPEWFETPTERDVVAALQYAQMAGDMCVVHGKAGAGKTSACRYWRETSPNVWLATMTAAERGVIPALDEVCDAVGVKEPPQGARKMLRAIRDRIARTNGLLIVDEAQHLGFDALEALRSLHDATGVGLALVGNDVVYTRLTGGARAESFAQLYSRMGKRVSIKVTRDGDVRALADAWEVAGKPERDFLAAIGGKPGALRNCTKVMRLATMLAAGDSETLALDHLRRAWTGLSAEESLT